MTSPYGTPMTMLELEDCRLPYWRIGSGPDLVFVHGWPLDVVLRSSKAEDFDEIAEAHPRITAPVRLIWGRRDPWFRLKDAEVMLESFGGQKDLKVLDDAGLMVHEEQPGEFSRAAGEHFDRCFAQSA